MINDKFIISNSAKISIFLHIFLHVFLLLACVLILHVLDTLGIIIIDYNELPLDFTQWWPLIALYLSLHSPDFVGCTCSPDLLSILLPRLYFSHFC